MSPQSPPSEGRLRFGMAPAPSPGWARRTRRLGAETEALKVLDQLFELSKQRYVTPYGVARIHATLGNKEEALHWLDAAYASAPSGWYY